MKIRIPARVADFLLGSQAAYTPESDVDMAAIIGQLRARPARADGSRLITLDDADHADTLRIYVEAMETGAADTVGYADEGLNGLADLNAARAVLRALAAGAR